MTAMDEFDEKLLRIEAQAAVREVSFAVNFVEISTSLPSSEEMVYLNLKTKEEDIFCVELSVSGFKVVGHEFNKVSEDNNPYFETIYQLLDSLSPQYRNSFGNALMDKLNQLKNRQSDD